MSGLEENWQFVIFLIAIVALGWQIFRSNRDMFVRLATKEDIGRVESRLDNLESGLSNLESRVGILETRLIEYEGKRIESLEKANKLAENLEVFMKVSQEYLDKFSSIGDKFKGID